MRQSGWWFGLVVLAGMIGCSKTETVPESAGELARLDWMLGRWEMVEEDHTLTEEWQQIDSANFLGAASKIVGSDTIPTEKLEIRATDSGVFYIADVPQNPEPVWFKLTEGSDTTAVFENPEHDLPNLISYRLESPGIIRVRVAGVRDGAPTGFELLFARAASDSSGADSVTP